MGKYITLESHETEGLSKTEIDEIEANFDEYIEESIRTNPILKAARNASIAFLFIIIVAIIVTL